MRHLILPSVASICLLVAGCNPKTMKIGSRTYDYEMAISAFDLLYNNNWEQVITVKKEHLKDYEETTVIPAFLNRKLWKDNYFVFRKKK